MRTVATIITSLTCIVLGCGQVEIPDYVEAQRIESDGWYEYSHVSSEQSHWTQKSTDGEIAMRIGVVAVMRVADDGRRAPFFAITFAWTLAEVDELSFEQIQIEIGDTSFPIPMASESNSMVEVVSRTESGVNAVTVFIHNPSISARVYEALNENPNDNVLLSLMTEQGDYEFRLPPEDLVGTREFISWAIDEWPTLVRLEGL